MPQKILVAEDDPLSQFMMQEVLDLLGYECDIAENGKRCLELISMNPDRYLAVLMDIHMPQMTGIDASKEIRNQGEHPPKNSPIYAVTADEYYHDDKKMKGLGFNGVLPKPVNIDNLQSVLDRLAA